MPHVFISYKREDAARVRKLVAALRGAGLETWWDEDIPPSAAWEATIEKALREAKAVIVCWSPAAVESENVRSEARVAREDGRLIQVLIKPCLPPLFFGERQAVDLCKWRGNADDKRLGDLAGCVRGAIAGKRPEGERSFPNSPWRRVVEPRNFKRIITIGAIALLVVCAGMLLAYQAAIARAPPRVAVLPFEDLSPARDQAYFAEGVAEEILSSLSTDQNIRVLGRTSARQIDRNADPRDVRKALGVTYLLEGSTRSAGGHLRVNVRLIDTTTGTSVWQEEYQGRLSDVFVVQDQIASTVAERLRGMLSGTAKLPESASTRINVYQSYLAARAIMRNRTEPTLRQALGLAQQVVRSDPNYAPGRALLAELNWLLSDDPNSYGTIPVAEASRVGEMHASAAIHLSPRLADGYAALGLVLSPSASIEPFRRAIQLDPSRADVRIWAAMRLAELGRHDEALQLAKDAVEIEPLWHMPLEWLVASLAASGRQQDARQAIENFRRRGGSQAQYHRLLFLVLEKGSDLSAAIAEGEKARAIDPTLPDLSTLLVPAYAAVGLMARAPTDIPPAQFQFSELFYGGSWGELDKIIRGSDARLWTASDGDVAFFSLGARRDWGMLTGLFDVRPAATPQLCLRYRAASQSLVPALRAAGRPREAGELMKCMRDLLAVESKQKARAWDERQGQFEYDQATVAALDGKPKVAIRWLGQAVDRGWIGLPYSTRIGDRPQFDSLRTDRRVTALQTRISATIMRERDEILSRKNDLAGQP